jgi:hypothetical protein
LEGKFGAEPGGELMGAGFVVPFGEGFRFGGVGDLEVVYDG